MLDLNFLLRSFHLFTDDIREMCSSNHLPPADYKSNLTIDSASDSSSSPHLLLQMPR